MQVLLSIDTRNTHKPINAQVYALLAAVVVVVVVVIVIAAATVVNALYIVVVGLTIALCMPFAQCKGTRADLGERCAIGFGFDFG
jgi:hypothetical protein